MTVAEPATRDSANPIRHRAENDGDVAELLVGREPERFTTEQRKAKRGGRILLDVMRNAYAHTAVRRPLHD